MTATSPPKMLPFDKTSMASPTPKRPRIPTPDDFLARYPPRPEAGPPEVVDPIWLLKAIGIALVIAAVFAYLSVCLLVYQGGWQRILFPTHVVDKTPPISLESLRFDAAATGHPRLAAWWMPGPSPNAPTILFLHDGTGSLSSSIRTLTLLHGADVNIFAFDYRGFGQSDGPHPSQIHMQEDAAAALEYLTQTRHIAPGLIVPYGQGLGAVLAATLVTEHPGLPALIVDTPDPDALSRVTSQDRSRLLPMRLLVRDHFDIISALSSCGKPKLLLADSPFGFETERLNVNQALFRSVPDPKFTVAFASPHSEDAYVQAISRFLDEYVARKGL